MKARYGEVFSKSLRRLTPSRIALGVNLPLVLSGLPFGSFDAYFHIFMADHYRLRWFDLLEPRWFGGFSVASYPPLVHQLIALLSVPASALAELTVGTPHTPQVSRFWGETVGFSLLLLIVFISLPPAVERFAGIFVPARAARTAAWLSVGLPSIYLTAYSFGQLPTLAATVALLWALAGGWLYCHSGRWGDLLLAILGAGVTAAVHHAVLLFAVFAGAALAGRLFLSLPAVPALPNEKNKASGPAALALAARLSIWMTAAAAFGALLLWPFIVWSQGYIPQAPIDHASRHNLLTDWVAAYYFFGPMYGPTLLALPFLAGWCLAWRKRRHWPLLVLASVLFGLGLGGTTPLPRLLFGANWDWLTYDRFALWAGLALLPLAGLLYHLYSRRATWLKRSVVLSQIPFCLYAAFASVLIQAQPPAVDVETIAHFLNTHTPQGERYLTFGFGDQLARLSVLTQARTIDGTYFTGRAIPELRESGLGALDGAMWNPAGPWAILPFLDRAPAWGIRWAFSAHPAYRLPLLSRSWTLEGEIVPGVLLWRNPALRVATEWQMLTETDARAGLWWGVAPLGTLAAAGVLWLVRLRLWKSNLYEI